jgi:CRISPR-associated endonuclease Csn1
MSDRTNQREGELLDEPWENFRDTIKERVAKVWVSHRVERKVSGALHEETQYGKTERPDWWVTRKAVDTLKANEIPNIRDPLIRDLVISKLKQARIDFGRKAEVDPKRLKEILADLRMPSGVPIRKVRVLKTDKTIRSIRKKKSETFVKPGSTHHLSIFEWEENGKKRRAADFLTMLEASQRSKKGASIIQREAPARNEKIPTNARFVMSLAQRETVLVEQNDKVDLLIFRTAASTQGQIYFSHHSDARSSNDYKKMVFSANTLRGRKVTVDLLGRIRNAGD